jgi:hypothetical protein
MPVTYRPLADGGRMFTDYRSASIVNEEYSGSQRHATLLASHPWLQPRPVTAVPLPRQSQQAARIGGQWCG